MRNLAQHGHIRLVGGAHFPCVHLDCVQWTAIAKIEAVMSPVLETLKFLNASIPPSILQTLAPTGSKLNILSFGMGGCGSCRQQQLPMMDSFMMLRRYENNEKMRSSATKIGLCVADFNFKSHHALLSTVV